MFVLAKRFNDDLQRQSNNSNLELVKLGISRAVQIPFEDGEHAVIEWETTCGIFDRSCTRTDWFEFCMNSNQKQTLLTSA